MLITRKRLLRRTILRGAGAALGLPLLDGMVPPQMTIDPRLAAQEASRVADGRQPFAQVIRASVSSGEFPGAVAAVATRRLFRVEAYGFRDIGSQSPMETDTICRIGSMAKTVHTACALR